MRQVEIVANQVYTVAFSRFFAEIVVEKAENLMQVEDTKIEPKHQNIENAEDELCFVSYQQNFFN